MEPRWSVIGAVIGAFMGVVVCFVLAAFISGLWKEFNQEIASFLSTMNSIGEKGAPFGEQMKGVLALGMIEALILGIVVIMSRSLGSR